MAIKILYGISDKHCQEIFLCDLSLKKMRIRGKA